MDDPNTPPVEDKQEQAEGLIGEQSEAGVLETNETEPNQPEEQAHGVCKECEGTGLSDLKTMGSQASKLCEACAGSGTI